MASLPRRGKALPFVHRERRIFGRLSEFDHSRGEVHMVGGIAIAMFVALAGWGGRYFGWDDPSGKVQLALVTAFILGVIGGFKARG
jgi:hypothetical protein